MHNKPLNRPEGDRIVILQDTKGTGKADKATTFYQAPDLYGPMGIAVAKDPIGPGWKVFVCQSPDILVFEDKDGDGKADGPPKKLLSGFGGEDHDHGVHGILIGPDMKLYFSVGDRGVHGLQSSDGKGRKWESNDTDCRAGTIWRCDMDGKNLELLAHNFRNEYEPCVDSFGTIFVSDNDDDGEQQTRICYVMPGGNYGYHPRGKGQSHWHEEQPGVVPKILRTYFGSPTGMCVYEGTLLPRKYWGQLLHTDAGPRQVRSYRLKPKGAGYDVVREDLVTSTDNWFRPSDICVAPDGSAFVSDWYDPGVGGHGMGDTTRGRIYRLAPKGNKSTVPLAEVETNNGIIAALVSPALSVRYMAISKIRLLPKNVATAWIEAAFESFDSAESKPEPLAHLARVMAMSSDLQPQFDFWTIDEDSGMVPGSWKSDWYKL
jgi:putative membrane-bound dehydrogenase-like protein